MQFADFGNRWDHMSCREPDTSMTWSDNRVMTSSTGGLSRKMLPTVELGIGIGKF